MLRDPFRSAVATCRAPCPEQTLVDRGQSHHRITTGDADVARGSELNAPAQAVAVDRGDDRLVHCLQQPEAALLATIELLGHPLGGKHVEVQTGAETPAAS